MKRTAKILSAVSFVAALGAGAAVAANPGLLNLPDEVKKSSIKVPENTETQAEFAKLATVTQKQAVDAALAVMPGKVVKAKLDDEDGYLVWQIDVAHAKGTTEIAVDAGNGAVLAAEAEEDDDHGTDRHEDRSERS